MTSFRSRLLCIAALVLAAIAAVSSTRAQCRGWQPGDGFLGTENQVFASLTWDPDGSGPREELLVIAGQFEAVGTEPYNFLAAFDGERFLPLGDNFFAGSPVIFVHNGDLYGGGAWFDSGGQLHRGVARFNAATFQWEQIGDDFDDLPAVLSVYEGQLVVGGLFSSIGSVPANRIARWDGSSWQPIGSGLGGVGEFFSPIDIVVSIKEFQGVLYAAGTFELSGDNQVVGSIARWNGSMWLAVGGGGASTGSNVYSMDSDGQKLYIGGDFDSVGGLPLAYIASWDGSSYASVGGGTNTWVYDIRAAAPGQIVVAGLFARVGASLTAHRIAKWDATAGSWSTYGLGFNNDVLTTAEYKGRFFAFGRFWYSGQQPMSFAAEWTGSEWRPLRDRGVLGQGAAQVYSLGTYQGSLIAGGIFRALDRVPLQSIARRVGDSWQSLNAPLQNSFSPNANLHPAVYGIAELNGKLYIGGTWIKVGAATSMCVAQFDGTTWSGMGSGANHNVLCVTAHDGAVYFGGLFGAMSGVPATSGIARWNGTQWSSVGGGTGGAVHAIVPLGADLIVGGGFTTAGGQPANNIARWDGTQWHAIGDGFNNPVKAVAVYDGQVYAGGKWITASGSTPIKGVARWNGSAWEQVGFMPGEFDNIEDMAVYNGRLYVCGTFATVDGLAVNNIACWDGTAWESLRGGIDGDVYALKSFGGELCVGGTTFSRVGGDGVSPSFARWRDDAGLYVASQPMDVESATGGSVQFHTRAGGAVDAVSYQWRRNLQPLTDGAGTSGVTVLGATSRSLTLIGVAAADAGSYDCVLVNACNTATTETVTLSVVGEVCAADLGRVGGVAGNDGVLDNNDFVVFIDYFFNADSRADCGIQGGVPGHDGLFDNNDFVVFIDAFFAGCP
ncbi:MAG TPA: immunoglobulin domain-containing protein [Phycisphaerales bacterium]|nr:immunoglobulin domain-containing protein [Phycisphaerales bacterium]